MSEMACVGTPISAPRATPVTHATPITPRQTCRSKPPQPTFPGPWAELVAEIESQPSAPHVKGGGNIAERFEVTELAHVYVAWLSETSLSHATQASATPYLKQVDDTYFLSRKPHASRGESLEGRCFVALDIALHAIAEVFDSEPLRLKLTDIEDRFAASADDMNES